MKDAHNVPQIYSNLHQNIQDRFNEEGIEIMSPHYMATRDGNEPAMPTNPPCQKTTSAERCSGYRKTNPGGDRPGKQNIIN